jgi:hypothetical protein
MKKLKESDPEWKEFEKGLDDALKSIDKKEKGPFDGKFLGNYKQKKKKLKYQKRSIYSSELKPRTEIRITRD